MPDTQRGWLDRAFFPDGEDPDPRFTLANERTYLAWVRTALAFLAGGITLHSIEIPGLSPRVQALAALTAVVVALVIALGAVGRWIRVERAMRHGRPLPVPGMAPLLVVAVGIAAVVLLVGILR